MLTYKELLDLRENFLKNEIDVDTAEKMFWSNFKKGEKSWHTKDWQERRQKFIKDKCEICEGVKKLTIQHLSHPKKYSEHKNLVERKYNQEYKDENQVINQSDFRDYVKEHYDYFPASICPKCKARKPNKRMRKTPKYLCTKCKSEFDETGIKTLEEVISIFYKDEYAVESTDKCFVSKDKWKNKHNLKAIRYWMERNNVVISYNEIIKKEIFLNYLDDEIKYLSFEDTITACNKCAFNFDINKMELCPKCKKNYKGLEYNSCIQCLPDDKRKAALEKIDFAFKMNEIHKNLGID